TFRHGRLFGRRGPARHDRGRDRSGPERGRSYALAFGPAALVREAHLPSRSRPELLRVGPLHLPFISERPSGGRRVRARARARAARAHSPQRAEKAGGATLTDPAARRTPTSRRSSRAAAWREASESRMPARRSRRVRPLRAVSTGRQADGSRDRRKAARASPSYP